MAASPSWQPPSQITAPDAGPPAVFEKCNSICRKALQLSGTIGTAAPSYASERPGNRFPAVIRSLSTLPWDTFYAWSQRTELVSTGRKLGRI